MLKRASTAARALFRARSHFRASSAARATASCLAHRTVARTAAAVEPGDGIERADSVIADGHKWLNVPYDTGFAFVRDPSLLAGAFSLTGAPYLPAPGEHASFGYLGPAASRRARGPAEWATLRA